MTDIAEVLVTGSHTAQADSRHYVDRHRAVLAKHIVASETVDNPTDGQLLARGRGYFAEHSKSRASGPG